MRALLSLVLAGLSSVAASGQSSPTIAPRIVEIASDTLRLKAFLWKPAGPGPFPAVVFNHGRSNGPQQHTSKLTITEAARILGPVFHRKDTRLSSSYAQPRRRRLHAVHAGRG